jgi:N-methylhydantoinase B
MDGVAHCYIPGDALAIDPGLPFWEGELPALDPVTYEVIRHNLWHINEEHGATIVKVSGSPIAIFGQDFNPCLMDERGDFIFFGPYLQFHAGMQDLTVKWILEHRSSNPGIEDGDIFLHNDPWVGTSHQEDVATMCPVFYEGKLFCWVGSTLHFADLGGPTPGGWCPDAESVYDEPLPTPPVKIVERGHLRRDIEELWVRRSRIPDLVALDLRAVIAGNNVARERVLRLVQRYGPGVVKAVMRKVVDDAESRFVEKMERLPDGVFREQGYLEAAGPGDRRTYRGVLTLRKDGRSLTFSNEGTDEQTGSINLTYAGWRGGILSVICPLLCFDSLFAIGGALRHCSFEPCPGTILCADYPASVSNGGAVGCLFSVALANNVVGKLMACDDQLRDEMTCATGISQWPVTSAYGLDQRGRPYSDVILDWYLATMGAQTWRDGINTGGTYWGPYHTAPNVEQTEQAMPVLYLYRKELIDSQGLGKFRSGTGPGTAWTPHRTDRITLNVSASGTAVPTALGLFGGYPGITNHLSVVQRSDLDEWHGRGDMPKSVGQLSGHRRVLAPKEKDLPILPGDVLESWSSGGAGYGDPLERDPHKVAEDVALGYMTAETAHRFHGLVVDERGEANLPATESLRVNRREQRLGRRPPRSSDGPPQNISFSVGDTLGVVFAAGVSRFVCLRCGQDLGPTAQNYKLNTVQRDLDLTASGPRIRDPHLFVDDAFVLRQFICPGCATLMDTRVARKDERPFQDIALFPAADEAH